MAFELTKNAKSKQKQIAQEPNLALEIEGVSTIYGAEIIKKYIRIGDPGLLIGDSWIIGGFNQVEDQESLISLDGSTTSIQQQLNQDKGIGSSISSIEIRLIDLNDKITKLITPTEIVPDVMGRRCVLWYGYADTAFKEDYIQLFRGVISDVVSAQGNVKLTIDHPDQKKKQDIYEKVSVKLNGAIGPTDTTITLTSTSRFLQKVQGPDLSYDPTFKSYVRIDDEIIGYSSISGNQLIGCTRGELTSVPNSHADQAGVETFYRLTGNVIDLALKIMLSRGGYFSTSVPATNFVNISPTEQVANSIFFYGKNVELDYGLVAGDYVTCSGSLSNNFTLKTIDEIVQTEDGSYIVINGVSFVPEFNTSGLLSFRSKYDTLPNGAGMHNDEVDILEHEKIKRIFLSSFEFDFYLKDTIQAKDFLEKEIYLPSASYSIPRKARSSLGYHTPPVAGSNIKVLDKKNIKNASKIQIRRSLGKNFYNTVVTKYNSDSLEDKFLRGVYTENATSKSQIKVGVKSFVIESNGLRDDLFGATRATSANNRILKRYAFGAEYIDGLEVLFSEGFDIEIGDIVLCDLSGLNVSDIETGKRGTLQRLFEVVNKAIDIKTGAVKLNVIDTNFDKDIRYGNISPSSKIKDQLSTTEILLKAAYNKDLYGDDEGKKWSKYVGAEVRIRKPDFTLVHNTTITQITNNKIKFADACPFAIIEDYIFELSNYSATQLENIKLVYAHMKNTVFVDGKPQYKML